ncbi:hypothetical protein IV203_007726 [Nitzschia inconspicua]|uniref:Uncharacterized protein n=1 Tax=Nitzschia inconspicua TaxID=303405 RepID=A0A9K3KYT0_9STRA|nr:hypothetical protein IV203_007726 [Nitzschia inconspicua]
MALFSIFRRSNSNDQGGGDDNNSRRGRRRWFRGRDSDKRPSCWEMICNMRVLVVLSNVFNIGMILLFLIVGVSIWENEWGHLVPSCLLSVAGIMGALRVNLTLTYISTIGFAILAFIYGVVAFYITGVIVCCCIIVTQMFLICQMMDGIVTKQDDALLSKEASDRSTGDV